MTKKIKIFLLVLSLICFSALCYLVATKNSQLISFDNSAINYFDSLRFPALDDFMLAITKIGDPIGSTIIFLILSIILVIKRKRTSLYIFALATILGTALQAGLKNLFERSRPIGGLIKETSYSFPSGHATISAVFLISIIFIFVPFIRSNFSKWVVGVAATMLFLLVAASRIFLWVHWPSDVIGGLLLGSICYLLASILCCHKNENML